MAIKLIDNKNFIIDKIQCARIDKLASPLNKPKPIRFRFESKVQANWVLTNNEKIGQNGLKFITDLPIYLVKNKKGLLIVLKIKVNFK